MTIEIKQTSGGIPVITENVPEAQNSGYMVVVNTGSRDESSNIFGISHLLEHTVFRGTKTRTSFQISKEAEGAGGEINAFTTKEFTAFYAVTLESTTKIVQDLIADVITNPLLTKDHVESEKKIVIQEISMYEQEPDVYIHELFDTSIWKGHELANETAGTKDTVAKLDYKNVREYYESKYKIPNLTVVACGAINNNDVVNWAEKNFGSMSGGLENNRKKPVTTTASYMHRKREEDHSYIAMGFRTFDAKNKNKPALQLLSAILGSGSSSRLFQSVREEKTLVYSVYSTINQFTDAGTLATCMSSTRKNVLEAIKTTAETYKSLKENGLSKGELQRAKNFVKGILTRDMESTSNRLCYLAKSSILTSKPESLDKRLESLDSVVDEDIMHVAEKVIIPEGLNIVMLGNDVKDMETFNTSQLDF
ncbi:MAG: insulinase family protein [archaeon]|nr:insulinase family protein [archaeon]